MREIKEIQDAIELTKKNIKMCEEMDVVRKKCNIETPRLATDIHKTILQALTEKLEREWTPVSERLPENKIRVMISRPLGNVGIGFCNRNSNNQWRDGEGYLITEPIAWQLLPEPYKEDKYE